MLVTNHISTIQSWFLTSYTFVSKFHLKLLLIWSFFPQFGSQLWQVFLAKLCFGQLWEVLHDAQPPPCDHPATQWWGRAQVCKMCSLFSEDSKTVADKKPGSVEIGGSCYTTVCTSKSCWKWSPTPCHLYTCQTCNHPAVQCWGSSNVHCIVCCVSFKQMQQYSDWYKARWW